MSNPIYIKVLQHLHKEKPYLELSIYRKTAKRDIDFWHEKKRFYLTLEVSQYLTDPSFEDIGFVADDVQTDIRIIRFKSPRSNGIVFPSFSSALSDIKETNNQDNWKDIVPIITQMKKETHFSRSDIENATSLRKKGLQEFKNIFFPKFPLPEDEDIF